MKRYPVKTFDVKVSSSNAGVPEALEAFDVETLLAKCGELLRREITNLLMESSGGKLAPNSSRDLVQYVKLLSELKAEQLKELADMTEEELKELNQV